MKRRRLAILVSVLGFAMVAPLARAGQDAGPAGAASGVADAGADTTDKGFENDDWIPIAGGRTTILLVEPRVGRPFEREPEFLRQVPSYRRAIEMDRDLRWAEATGHYQQALVEIGSATKFAPTPLLEQAAFKTDLERRRSRTLAQAEGADTASPPTSPPPGTARIANPPPRLPALDRARLLRLKLMAVRSATGAVPGGLVSATLGALGQALRKSSGANAGGGDPEVRLLLCATRAVAGDRTGARRERAHVSQSDRWDPTRALAQATCEAALGYNDQALAALAVVVHRIGPSPRFLPGQTRELQSSNDWDPLRADPRFERLFR